MLRILSFFVMSLCLVSAARAADDAVLIIEQDYNIVESGKGGVDAKDVRQKLFVHKDFVCIDEFGGKIPDQPTETVLIDLKKKQIVDLDHEAKTKVTESFDARRKRLNDKKRIKHEDLDAQPEGPQKDKIAKLWRALLDDDRKYDLVQDPADTKVVAGLTCQGLKIVSDDKNFTPAQFYLHPTIDMPYENAEVLYLLQIIGEKLAGFLKDHRDAVKKVPMELHLELAAGGHLDTKVVSVVEIEKSKLDAVARPLGNPFEVPAGYAEKDPHKVAPENKTDKPN